MNVYEDRGSREFAEAMQDLDGDGRVAFVLERNALAFAAAVERVEDGRMVVARSRDGRYVAAREAGKN